jgi:SAM-dependent methyltransferase
MKREQRNRFRGLVCDSVNQGTKCRTFGDLEFLQQSFSVATHIQIERPTVKNQDQEVAVTTNQKRQYHLDELAIARNPNDPRRIIPAIPRGSHRILDIGCGAGATLSVCKVDGEALFCGVDVDHVSLQLGRELFAVAHFIQAKGESLPFRSGQFDFVIARVSLPYMNIPRALSEIARVLRPGGSVWTVLHPFLLVRQELLGSIRRLDLKDSCFRVYVIVNGLWMHLVGKMFSCPLRCGRYESFQTSRSITAALLGAGLTDVKISREPFFVVTARKV